MLKAIFFDLDDTLYPRGSTLMAAIGVNITRFVEIRLNVSPEHAAALRRHWRDTYGTALRGMSEEGYEFDREAFFEFVHDVPVETLLTPDPAVRKAVSRIPLRRAVLTNSNIEHAERVLKRLDLADCFEQVIDIRALSYVNKPYPEAFRSACELMGVDAEEAILVEDTPVNTIAARELGMATILVDSDAADAADAHVANVSEVARVVEDWLRIGAPAHADHAPAAAQLDVGEPPDEI